METNRRALTLLIAVGTTGLALLLAFATLARLSDLPQVVPGLLVPLVASYVTTAILIVGAVVAAWWALCAWLTICALIVDQTSRVGLALTAFVRTVAPKTLRGLLISATSASLAFAVIPAQAQQDSAPSAASESTISLTMSSRSATHNEQANTATNEASISLKLGSSGEQSQNEQGEHDQANAGAKALPEGDAGSETSTAQASTSPKSNADAKPESTATPDPQPATETGTGTGTGKAADSGSEQTAAASPTSGSLSSTTVGAEKYDSEGISAESSNSQTDTRNTESAPAATESATAPTYARNNGGHSVGSTVQEAAGGAATSGKGGQQSRELRGTDPGASVSPSDPVSQQPVRESHTASSNQVATSKLTAESNHTPASDPAPWALPGAATSPIDVPFKSTQSTSTDQSAEEEQAVLHTAAGAAFDTTDYGASNTDSSATSSTVNTATATGTGTGTATGTTVEVGEADSLWSIARASLPLDSTRAEIASLSHQIYEANKEVIGSNPDLILPGQVLTIPVLMASR